MINIDTSGFWASAFMLAVLMMAVLAIVSLLRKNFKGRHQLIWLLIIIFLPLFGPILYFLIIKRYRKVNLVKRRVGYFRQKH
ncbi:PLDc N-terminal domain-containing protein [Salegentibacter sp. F60176]|uniref:PLDc N-terminal domain-containing protein n=2 Tax=Salegentibacter maritimus TaxID=2794347 RepID=A0ABS0TBU7_9FLAO|nr:PLDc N-terminal domain-containing protein [Salegentibacter maritimus]